MCISPLLSCKLTPTFGIAFSEEMLKSQCLNHFQQGWGKHSDNPLDPFISHFDDFHQKGSGKGVIRHKSSPLNIQTCIFRLKTLITYWQVLSPLTWTSPAAQNILMVMDTFPEMGWDCEKILRQILQSVIFWQAKGIFMKTLSHQGLVWRFSVAGINAALHSHCKMKGSFFGDAEESVMIAQVGCSHLRVHRVASWESDLSLWDS